MIFAFNWRRAYASAVLLAMAVAGSAHAIAESAARSTLSNQVLVAAKTSASLNGSATVNLTLPSDADRNTIHAVLNGKDISRRLTATSCEQGTCLTGTVSAADGLRTGKNVVYATAHTEQGRLVTGRARFLQSDTPQTAGGRTVFANAVRANDVSGSGPSTFLPAVVSFKTYNGGGWINSNSPWIQVGDSSYPASGSSYCPTGSKYLVLAFDHQTLAPIDLGSNDCQATSASLATYLTSLAPSGAPENYLVVVGTLFGQSADAQLDTSSIGGTKFATAGKTPVQYVAIGVPGATPGSAFENYSQDYSNDPTLKTPMYAFANGIVQEDQNGNYDYESSEVIEYWVDPFTTDPSADHPGVITVAPSLADGITNPSLKGYRFLPPALSSGTHRGGYWLLVVQRDTPWCNDTLNNCAQTPAPSPNDGLWRIANAGTLYYTGDTDPDTQQAAYQALTNDLNAVGPYDLAFLTTFSVGSDGYPVCCGDPWTVSGNTKWAASDEPSDNYYYFRNVLEQLGGSGRATEFFDWNTGQYNPKGAYTYVFSKDTGDPLSGHSAVSASAYSASGQTGYLHGLLARNLNGLYQPFQTSQQPDSAQDAASGPDYLMSKLATMQPVPWPELSTTVVMPGASSVAGQQAAYYYASYQLLTNYYIKGVSGNYLDNIHYFFTGSNVNYINYHSFDPVNLPAPAFDNNTGTFCWAGPPQSPYSAQVCFTPQDFSAVKQQLSNEVVDLTNVMNFMVTGPVNVKDLVATGNSNMGLALTSAAATILADNLTPATSTTKVKANIGNWLTMIGGMASLTADISGFPEAQPLLKQIGLWANIGGATLGAGGAYAEGLKSTTTTGTGGIPSRFISFTTTVGNLASSSLQDQMGIAFDTTLDSFLGDWGKLSVLGPKVTDNSTPYYSPDQIAQDASIQAMSIGAQRSFYMSLMPNFYGVYYFPVFKGVNNATDTFVRWDNSKQTPSTFTPTNQPDMGFYSKGSGYTYCEPIFIAGANGDGGATNQAPQYTFVWTPTSPSGYSLGQLPWDTIYSFQWTYTPVDFYVIAANPPSNPHTSQTSAKFMPDSLNQQLFTSAGFSIPLDLFVGQFGPLQSNWVDLSYAPRSASPLGYINSEICASRSFNPNTRGGDSSTLSDPPPGGSSTIDTTTTLTAPVAMVLGTTGTLQASVKAADNSQLATGNLIFLVDGASVGNIPVDGTGSASVALSGLALGPHSVQALYQSPEGYAPSQSAAATVGVYANAPDLALTLSAATLSVTYGTTSTPVTVQIQSLSGMAGNVTLSCSGLPVGMACSFNPAQATLPINNSASTTVTITSNAAKASNAVSTGMGVMCILPAGLVLLFGVRKRSRGIQQLLGLGILVALASTLVACGGSSSTKPVQEAGSKTVLINATCGSITKSIPLVLNIQ